MKIGRFMGDVLVGAGAVALVDLFVVRWGPADKRGVINASGRVFGVEHILAGLGVAFLGMAGRKYKVTR